MIKHLIYIAVIFILATLQTTLPLPVTPALLLGLTVCVALTYGRVEAGFVGLMSGLLIDFMREDTIGINALLILYIGVLAGYLRRYFLREKKEVAFIFIMVSVILYNFIYYIILFFLQGETRVLTVLWHIILPEAIMTTIFTMPMFLILRRIKNKGKALYTMSQGGSNGRKVFY